MLARGLTITRFLNGHTRRPVHRGVNQRPRCKSGAIHIVGKEVSCNTPLLFA